MAEYSEYEGRPHLQRQRARIILMQRLGIFVLLVYMGVTSAFVTWNAIQATQTRSTLLDCTQPTGKCFKDGAKRTGEAVTGIVNSTRAVIIATTVCKDKPGFENADTDKLEKCVDKELGSK